MKVTGTGLTLLMLGILLSGVRAPGQEKNSPSAKQHSSSLREELIELRARMARLQAALEGGHRADAGPSSGIAGQTARGTKGGAMGMKGMKAMKTPQEDPRPATTQKSPMSMGMKMMKKGRGMGMKGMSMGQAMKGMGMSMGMNMRKKSPMMEMMGRPPMTLASRQPSSLPGFPGISHVYHIGASSFFLDHAEHLKLTRAQLRKLAGIQEKAMLTRATLTRQEEEIEQQVWILTSSDTPDIRALTRKIEEAAAIRVKMRLSFIRAVGKAAGVLTSDQLALLKGAGDSMTEDAQSRPAKKETP